MCPHSIVSTLCSIHYPHSPGVAAKTATLRPHFRHRSATARSPAYAHRSPRQPSRGSVRSQQKRVAKHAGKGGSGAPPLSIACVTQQHQQGRRRADVPTPTVPQATEVRQWSKKKRKSTEKGVGFWEGAKRQRNLTWAFECYSKVVQLPSPGERKPRWETILCCLAISR